MMKSPSTSKTLSQKNTILCKKNKNSPASTLVSGPVFPLMFPTTIVNLPAPAIVVVIVCVTGIVYNQKRRRILLHSKLHVKADTKFYLSHCQTLSQRGKVPLPRPVISMSHCRNHSLLTTFTCCKDLDHDQQLTCIFGGCMPAFQNQANNFCSKCVVRHN